MNKEKLFEMLDIESGAGFEYFDNMSDLLECDEYIDEDIIFLVMEEADINIVKGLFETYFEDITESVPDQEAEFVALMEMMKLAFMGICENGSNAVTYDKLSEEIVKFRNWFVFKKSVKRGDDLLNVRDALTNCRFNKLSGNEDRFDFTEALEYDLDEYAISIEEETEDIEELEEYEEL
ncbi:MAG: hypothetical protein JJE03_01175 [Peptostreptococcaceae bacterium]|nr:hypothetical protein [Peptostreptococcaceae bacterium]